MDPQSSILFHDRVYSFHFCNFYFLLILTWFDLSRYLPSPMRTTRLTGCGLTGPG